jgi:hypothetical protein
MSAVKSPMNVVDRKLYERTGIYAGRSSILETVSGKTAFDAEITGLTAYNLSVQTTPLDAGFKATCTGYYVNPSGGTAIYTGYSQDKDFYFNKP